MLVCVPPAAAGFHLISMKEFLTREGATGGLNPQRMPLPKNNTDLWGRDLWFYLNKVADATPCTSTRIAPPLFAPRFLFSHYHTSSVLILHMRTYILPRACYHHLLSITLTPPDLRPPALPYLLPPLSIILSFLLSPRSVDG